MRVILIALVALASCGRAGFDSLLVLDAGAGGSEDADLGLSRAGELTGCPVMSSSADGKDALVAWPAYSEGESVADVRFSRIDDNGSTVIAPLTVGSAAGVARTVAVFEVAEGYAVFYESEDQLLMARLDAEGSPIEQVLIAGGIDHSSVAETPSGYLITWEAIDGNREVILHAADSSGALVNQTQVAVDATEPSALRTTAGTLVVYGYSGGVRAILVNANANITDGPLTFGAFGYAKQIAQAVDASGNVLAAHRGNDERRDLHYRFLALSPLATSSEDAVMEPSNRGQWARASVTVAADGNFVVVRQSDASSLVEQMVLQTVTPGGVAGDPVLLSSPSESTFCPTVLGLADGVLAAWAVDRETTRALVVKDVTAP